MRRGEGAQGSAGARARTPARLGRLGIGLGVSHVAIVAAVILLNLDRLPRLFEALRALSDLR